MQYAGYVIPGIRSIVTINTVTDNC